MLLPGGGGGGTESRSLEPSGENRAARGESERGLNPLSLGGGGPPPEKFVKFVYLRTHLSHFEAHFSIFYNLNFK